jgi:hypothetical protein
MGRPPSGQRCYGAKKGFMASNRIARLHVAPITPGQEIITTVMQSIFARHKSRLRIIAPTVLLRAIAGCGGPSRDLVGKWRMSQDANAMVWEFYKNGAVLIENTRGRYTLDRNRVKIETPFAKTVYQMEFLGDHMILREPGGPSSSLREQKKMRADVHDFSPSPGEIAPKLRGQRSASCVSIRPRFRTPHCRAFERRESHRECSTRRL